MRHFCADNVVGRNLRHTEAVLHGSIRTSVAGWQKATNRAQSRHDADSTHTRKHRRWHGPRTATEEQERDAIVAAINARGDHLNAVV